MLLFSLVDNLTSFWVYFWSLRETAVGFLNSFNFLLWMLCWKNKRKIETLKIILIIKTKKVLWHSLKYYINYRGVFWLSLYFVCNSFTLLAWVLVKKKTKWKITKKNARGDFWYIFKNIEIILWSVKFSCCLDIDGVELFKYSIYFHIFCVKFKGTVNIKYNWYNLDKVKNTNLRF